MPWSGSGIFNRKYTWVDDRDANIPITASRMDDEMDDMASGIQNAVAKDGQNTPTANLPMGTYKHTGVGNASARTDYAATGQVQDGSFVYAADTGAADTIEISLNPAVTALVTGQAFRFKANNTNTGATTLQVNSTSAQSLVRDDGSALSAGDIQSGEIYWAVYDGTNFILMNPDLGTAAFEDIGTSGDALGKLNANKTDSGDNTFSGTNNFTGTLQQSGNAVLTTADEGSGNGLDADTVDGVEAATLQNPTSMVIGSCIVSSSGSISRNTGDITFSASWSGNVCTVTMSGNSWSTSYTPQVSIVDTGATGSQVYVAWVSAAGATTITVRTGRSSSGFTAAALGFSLTLTANE